MDVEGEVELDGKVDEGRKDLELDRPFALLLRDPEIEPDLSDRGEPLALAARKLDDLAGLVEVEGRGGKSRGGKEKGGIVLVGTRFSRAPRGGTIATRAFHLEHGHG